MPRRSMRMSEAGRVPVDLGSYMEALIGVVTQRLGRAPVVLALDSLAAAIAYACHLGIFLPAIDLASVQTWMPLAWLVPLTITGSLLSNVYRRSWRHVSVTDLPGLTAFAMLVTLSFGALWAVRMDSVQTVKHLVIFGVLLFALLVGLRLLVRTCFSAGRRGRYDNIPILIVGGDCTAENFIRASKLSDAGPRYRPVGILTRRPADTERTIHGVPVLGTYDQFEDAVRALRRRGVALQHVALSSSREEIDFHLYRKLHDAAQKLELDVARLRRVTELEKASALPGSLMPVAVSDLLGRTQVHFDSRAVSQSLGRKRLLITGAGGTIGAELSRQVAQLNPEELILLDQSEYNLYQIELQIREAGLGDRLHCLLCDVRDSARVCQIFARHRPEILFHAAAMKHVPIVEEHPCEGVLTNILGTCNVADTAFACGVRMMTLVSTDKAVHPKNAMGITKRICERYCQSLDAFGSGTTRFIAVRFGNVAASSGSVIPLFQRQIALGGPLTVTHPDAHRFFMTTKEAVELVLRATSLGLECTSEDGRIYVLDMGEPIRIAELAAQMIRLAGFAPGRDVEIEFVGLRPGESLNETLFHRNETVRRTSAPRISEAVSTPISYSLLRSTVDDLVTAARRHDQAGVRRLLATTARLCDSERPGRMDDSVAAHACNGADMSLSCDDDSSQGKHERLLRRSRGVARSR
jgi:FlaA1/EpsC-like NDP-sugar epimerase